MGHNRLLRLPASRSWQQVVELLGSSAPAADVIAAAARAAQGSFRSASDDPVYVEAVRILAALSNSGTAEAIGPALRREGIPLDRDETLLSFLSAVSDRLESKTRANGYGSDLGELARRALLETLHTNLLERMPGLFSEQPGDLANAVRFFSGPAGFSALTRSFFTTMTSETLAYWLERTLSAQIDDGNERDAFDDALTQFSSEATKIIQEFSKGWFAKHALGEHGISLDKTRAFAAIAFKKINDELQCKTRLHA